MCNLSRARKWSWHSASVAKLDINWARDRQTLWNAAEVAEKREDARVAREYEVALPHELDSRLESIIEDWKPKASIESRRAIWDRPYRAWNGVGWRPRSANGLPGR